MKKILVTSTLFLIIVSCTQKIENHPLENNAVDKVESSVSNSVKSARGKENMVLEIYSELVKNDKNLQNLEEKIEHINNKTNVLTFEYENIINKSDKYYIDAKHLTRLISDSLMKEKIESEITLSSKNYELKTKRIKDLIVKINQNISTIHDQHTVFKIKKTLSEIEKYQSVHPLKTDSLENFIHKQNELLNELKTLK